MGLSAHIHIHTKTHKHQTFQKQICPYFLHFVLFYFRSILFQKNGFTILLIGLKGLEFGEEGHRLRMCMKASLKDPKNTNMEGKTDSCSSARDGTTMTKV